MKSRFVRIRSAHRCLAGVASAIATVMFLLVAATPASAQRNNVILFVGDGMGVSTVTSTRIATVGVDGQLTMDRMPYTAISRTASADYITPDSAATMSAMMTGVNTNTGVIGYGPTTEFSDFNGNGDGPRLTNIGELAISMGYAVGIVTTTRVTHATPAAVFAHVNDRNLENEIAAQMVPGGGGFNTRLGDGLHVIFGGGRRHFLPTSASDDEGLPGRRSDGRDLRSELQQRGYRYVWNRQGLNSLGGSGRAIGLFASSHLAYEADRGSGEPSLEEMTRKAIQILTATGKPYFLMVEGGRIDHAHHEGNAFRAFNDTRMFDRAINAAQRSVNLNRTLILATADHSHVFTIAGYPMRPLGDLRYTPRSVPASFRNQPHHGILGTVHDIDSGGTISESGDSGGIPYTILGYANGPGHRSGSRVNPNSDRTAGYGGAVPSSTAHSAYRQEATVPLFLETHAGEDVMIYAVGRTSENVRGTVPNSKVFDWIKDGFADRGSRPSGPGPSPDPDPDPGPAPDPVGTCTPTSVVLRFDGGYEVSMCYVTPEGESGSVKAEVWSSEAGILWFFGRNNPEVLVKVLDGCGVNGHRWAFVAPVTTLDFNLWITGPDGSRWTHGNPQGTTAATKSDIKAFPCQ
ncbi:MAG: alkaline phosphatase [Acidobacteria bacterium]|nr:alkaline phosphatase [Acidobacteriota bacterium]